MERLTERLSLRELRLDDAAAANRYERDPAVVRYQSSGVRTLDESRAYIVSSLATLHEEPRVTFDLALCLRATGEYIGRIGLQVKSRASAEGTLWYVIDPAHQGRGYVTEAARSLLDLAFGDLALHRVYVDCDPRNVASIRVAEKLGMRQEARHRENFFCKGEWTDSVILAILDREWRR